MAVAALAHITVSPGSAPAGSAAVLTFHVPSEEAHTDTTRLDMRIPTDHPIATYSNGDVVRWIDVAQPGQPAPDHPAPVLTLTTAAASVKSTAVVSDRSSSDGMAPAVAAAGLVADRRATGPPDPRRHRRGVNGRKG